MKGFDVVSIIASPDGRTLVTLDRPSRDRHGPGSGPGNGRRSDFDGPPGPPLGPRPTPTPPRRRSPFRPVKPDPSRTDAQPGGRPRPFLVAIAPDGSTIAAARLNETEVSLWDRDGKPLDVPTIDVQVNISALAVGPAGLLAASGGGEIVVWDLAQRKPLPGLGRLQGYIIQLRFSPTDGSLLAAATGGGSGGVELWDLTSHSMVAALQTKEVVEDIAFSPDGKTLAATQPKSIALWSIVEPLAQVQLPESGERPIALAFGPGDRLAIASRDEKQALGALKLWGEPGRCPPEVQTWGQVRPGGVGFDDQGRLMTIDSTALRWFDPDGSQAGRRCLDPRPWPTGLARRARPGGGPPRSPENRNLDRILSAQEPRRPDDGDPAAPVGRNPDLEGRRPRRLRQSSTRPSTPPRATRDGRGICLGDGAEPRRFEALRPSRGPGRGVHVQDCPVDPGLDWTAEVREATTIAVAPDGQTLAVGERSGDLALIETASGAIRRPKTPPDDATGPVASLAFRARSPDPGRRHPRPGPALGRRRRTPPAGPADRPPGPRLDPGLQRQGRPSRRR